VVGAMALLLTVALVIGAVRSKDDEGQEHVAAGQKPASPAAALTADKRPEPTVAKAESPPSAAAPAEPAPSEPAAAEEPAKPAAKVVPRTTAVATKKTGVKPGWGLPKPTAKQKLSTTTKPTATKKPATTTAKKTTTTTTTTAKKTTLKKPATR